MQMSNFHIPGDSKQLKIGLGYITTSISLWFIRSSLMPQPFGAVTLCVYSLKHGTTAKFRQRDQTWDHSAIAVFCRVHVTARLQSWVIETISKVSVVIVFYAQFSLLSKVICPIKWLCNATMFFSPFPNAL